MQRIWAAVMRAVRSAMMRMRGLMAGIRGAYEWIDESWDEIVQTPFGSFCADVVTAAKIPVAVAGATFGLKLLSDREMDRIATGVEAVGKGAMATLRGVNRAASTVVSTAVAAVADVVRLPGNLVGALTRPAPTPAGAAVQGRDNAAAVTDTADAQSAIRIKVAAVRRIASAIAKGAKPDADAIASLTANQVAYLMRLRPAEASVLVTAPSASLRTLLESGIAPVGVRSSCDLVEETREENQAAWMSVTSGDRKAEFRAAVAARRAEAFENMIAANA